jgi:hypothetical protein
LVDIVRKVRNTIGGIVYEGLPASPAHLTLVEGPPVYAPGFVVLRQGGVAYTTMQDLGDEVLFTVGESYRELRGGNRLKLPAGNTCTVHKSDLILDQM